MVAAGTVVTVPVESRISTAAAVSAATPTDRHVTCCDVDGSAVGLRMTRSGAPSAGSGAATAAAAANGLTLTAAAMRPAQTARVVLRVLWFIMFFREWVGTVQVRWFPAELKHHRNLIDGS